MFSVDDELNDDEFLDIIGNLDNFDTSNSNIKKGTKRPHTSGGNVILKCAKFENDLNKSHSRLSHSEKSCPEVLSNRTSTPLRGVIVGSVDSPSSCRKRKFPGPAGLLPKIPLDHVDEHNVKNNFDEITPKKIIHDFDTEPILSQDVNVLFDSEAWRMLKEELEPGVDAILAKWSLENFSIQSKLKTLSKHNIPIVCGIIESLNLTTLDASVVIRDPTGKMTGTIHRQVMKEYASVLKVGSVLVLRQVSIFSPGGRNNYLNITPNTLVRIYSGCENSAISCQNISYFSDEEMAKAKSDSVNIMDISGRRLATLTQNSSSYEMPLQQTFSNPRLFGYENGHNAELNNFPSLKKSFVTKSRIICSNNSPHLNKNHQHVGALKNRYDCDREFLLPKNGSTIANLDSNHLQTGHSFNSPNKFKFKASTTLKSDSNLQSVQSITVDWNDDQFNDLLSLLDEDTPFDMNC